MLIFRVVGGEILSHPPKFSKFLRGLNVSNINIPSKFACSLLFPSNVGSLE